MNALKKNKQDLKKDFIWNTIGSTINAFSSLFYMVIVTRINGVNDAGIFTFAFSTAALFYMVGIYAGRTYQVTDSDNISNHDYLINKCITCLVMFAISLIFIFCKNYSLNKAIVILLLCILKLLEAFSEFFYAYIQKNNMLYKVGLSLVMKTVLSILVFIIVDIITRSIIISSVFLIIAYLLVMIIYDFNQFSIINIIKERYSKSNIKSIFINGFFTFCLSFSSMYIVNIPRYSVDRYLSDKFNTIFGILIMPASAMVLLSQFIIQPLLMKIKDNLDKKDYSSLRKIIVKISVALFLIGLLVLLLTFLVGIPVLQLIYGVDLLKYRMALMYVMIGSVLYSMVIIFSNIMISMRVTFLQVVLYVFNVVFSLFLSNVLVHNFKVVGACMTYCFTMVVLFGCFLILIISSINLRIRKCKNG